MAYRANHVQHHRHPGSKVDRKVAHTEDDRAKGGDREVASNTYLRSISADSVTPGLALSRADIASRAHVMQRIQQQQGNAYVQRALGEWFQDKWEGVKEALGAEPDEEKALSELNDGLGRAQKLCERAAVVVSDPAAAKRLEAAAEKFGQVTDKIGTGLSIRGAARDVVKFVDAIETLESIDDIRQDPDKAAKAFGQLFSSAGKLGQRLPEGPWSAYFEWLAASEEFFVNMRSKIDPELRWKKQFQQIDGFN